MSNLHARLEEHRRYDYGRDYSASEIAPLRGTIDNALKHAFRKVFGYDPFRDGNAIAHKHHKHNHPWAFTWT